MRFLLLGPAQAHDSTGRPVAVGGARLAALLTLLALEPGRTVSAERLVDAIWGDAPPDRAAGALQALASRLRRLLADPDAVESRPGGYRLRAGPDDVDTHVFARLAARGRDELAAGEAAAADATLARAQGLWRGPALADTAALPFAHTPVARLGELRLQVAEDRARARVALGRAQEAAVELEPLADAHPLRERLQARLVHALHAAGRQADALERYRRTRAALVDELGVEPGPELAEAHLAVLRGHPQPPPAPEPAPLRAPRGRLGAPLTTFVGRERELVRLAELLPEARLVTLTGPGGAGKTRLSVEAATRLAAERPETVPDGVWFVELAPLGDGDSLPQAVAAVFGRHGSPHPFDIGKPEADPLVPLIGELAQRRLLLVLDNCEHLIDAAARLAERLLAACPGLRVLATSREGLGVPGEIRYAVPAMELPPDGADAAAAAGYASVRLFADRAASARPGFAVDDGNVASVVRICRELDGQPLAIELAAARVAILTPDQIADRLHDRFALLTGGSRTALPRHQTLRGVVDWSWELLDKPERALLRRLSAFPAGAAIDGVERVCAADELPAADVLDTVAALVDKSLVTVVETSDGSGRALSRYRLLETVRAYGAEQLDAAGETERVRAALAEYQLELWAEGDAGLRGPEQRHWTVRLAGEHDNLRAALRWAVDTGRLSTALRMAARAVMYWQMAGNRKESAHWGAELMRRLPEPPPDAVAEYIECMSLLDIGGEDPLGALIERTDRAVALMARHGVDELNRPLLVSLPAMAAMLHGRLDEAAELMGRKAAAGDPWVSACGYGGLGMLNSARGDWEGARAAFEAALRGFARVGDQAMEVQTLIGLSELVGLDDGEEALRLLRAAERTVVRLMPQSAYTSLVQVRIAAELLRHDRPAEALATLEDSAARFEMISGADDHKFLTTAAWSLYHRVTGRPDLARARIDAALTRPVPKGVAGHGALLLLLELVWVDLAEGDVDGARRRLGEAARVRALFVPLTTSALLIGHAGLAMAEGRPGRAAELIGASEALRGRPDNRDVDTRRLLREAGELLGAAEVERIRAAGRRGAAAIARETVDADHCEG
ncbi:AfsR/SARP family transcriptional regulator [Allonocardiopsis opalescens]|uniref:AfsR/SARP family transcriptional regulator n=1 Tax=Allonocardiopsis opalescens TaxID=1144618 RepID=UPI0014750550|nr:BTAD domain-containing putative transcriptional regulator [Allonocardiopsis opalescens]